jgi:hypothetical protein
MTIANYVLTATTLVALTQKGILSVHEANEVVEQALLNLETHQMSQNAAPFRPAVEFARERLEELRQALVDNSRT